MKRILCSFLIALFCASLARAIEAGDVAQDVTTVHGNPVAALKKADGSQVWMFKDGTTVWLADGIVQKIVGRTFGNRMRRPGSTVWSPVAAPILATTTAPAPIAPLMTHPAPKNQPADNMRLVRYFVLFGGLAMIVVVLRFSFSHLQAGVEWLLSGVFAPLVSLGSPLFTRRRSRLNRAWRAY